MAKKFQHRINYSERHGSINPGGENWNDSCPFHDYKNSPPESGRLILGICTHPLFKEGHIECHYGESEITVPKKCH